MGFMLLLYHKKSESQIKICLNIEIAYQFGIFFDELAARLYLIAHENRKELISSFGVSHFHAQHGTAGRVHGGFPELFRVHFTQTFVALYGDTVTAHFVELLGQFFIAVGIPMLLALANLIERRLGNEHMTMLNQRFHIAIEERQQQRTDMRAIDIGICHDDDFAVTAFCQIKIIADARTECRNHRADFGVGKNLIETCLFYVQNLTAQGQDSLETAVTALLGGTACRVTLDEVDFGHFRVFDGAVCQLTGQARYFQRVLAARKFTCLAGGFTGAGGHDGLFDKFLGDGRIFLEVFGQTFRYDGIHNTAHFAVAQLGLGLTFELRVTNLEADNRRQAFAHIITGEVAVLVLEDALLAGKVVGCARQRELEAGQMRAAFFGVDVVDEGVDILLIAVVILQGDFYYRIILRAVEVNRLRIDFFLSCG